MDLVVIKAMNTSPLFKTLALVNIFLFKDFFFFSFQVSHVPPAILQFHFFVLAFKTRLLSWFRLHENATIKRWVTMIKKILFNRLMDTLGNINSFIRDKWV